MTATDIAPVVCSSYLIKDRAFLRAVRRSRGMTQDDVAEIVGVSRSAVAHWEIGRNRGVSPTHAHRLARALIEPLDAIFVTASE